MLMVARVIGAEWLQRIAVGIAAALAVWLWCIVPFQFEIALRGLENSTRAAMAASSPESQVIARQTLGRVAEFRGRFPGDVRLAMIEAANERLIGRPEDAVAAYRRALQYDRRPEIYFNLAIAESDAHDKTSAAQHLAQALRFSPALARDVSDETLKRRAIAIIRSGHTSAPFCCAAQFASGRTMEVVRIDVNGATAIPSDRPLRLGSNVIPQFAWNDDHRTNIVARSGAGDAAAVLVLAPNGTLQAREALPPLGPDWHIGGSGTFAANPRIRALVLSNIVTSEAKVWTLAGNSRVTESAAPSFVEPNAYVAACADFDGDGYTDAVYRSTNGDDTIWLMAGTVRKAPVQLPAAGFQRALVGAADFTGDGRPDLLWYDFETRRMLLWVMNGTSVQKVAYWP